MSRCVYSIAILLAVLILAGTPADAGKLPLPCTGDKLVKVAELPGASTASGVAFDLGYLFKGCSGGEWVGYTGVSDRYVSLSTEFLAAYDKMMAEGKAPTPPGLLASALIEPGQFWAEWLWLIMISLGVAGHLYKHSRSGGDLVKPDARQRPNASARSAAMQRRAMPPETITEPAGQPPVFGRRRSLPGT